MTEARGAAELADLATVRSYHVRTKHHLQRYAAGPETLDWDAQPDPFRRWAGAPLQLLPLLADRLRTPWSDLFVPGAIAPQPLARDAVAMLLELSFGLSAWKRQGPDRWAVRCTPSSGNLHPTEAWLVTNGMPGLEGGLYHYAPREHGLEQRAAFTRPAAPPRALIGLSSIHWREAWKYGERAFRYCQLDVGHALGALRYAAALLGWRLQTLNLGTAELAGVLGLDRDDDFGPAEREDPELLLELLPARQPPDMAPPDPPSADIRAWACGASWHGRPNRLDRRPMYRWPVIGDVARASALPSPTVRTLADLVCTASTPDCPACLDSNCTGPAAPGRSAPACAAAKVPAAQLIRQRRSAQRFDNRVRLPLERLLPLLKALASPRLPLDLPLARSAHVHPLIFVHGIDGLAPGAYLLPRRSGAEAALRASLADGLDWIPVGLPAPAADLRLLRLTESHALAGTLRTLNCHQALGSDALLAFALLAEFDALLGPGTDPASADAPAAAVECAGPTCRPAAWHYRRLFHEAGLLGQLLYMEAEAAGLAGTGIGCYFDDGLHQLIGLRGTRFQSIYHFTVGVRVADPRIETDPPYPFCAERPGPKGPTP